jgi:hypothetical protein
MSCEKIKNMQIDLKKILDNNNSTIEDYKAFFNKYNIAYSNNFELNIQNFCTIISGTIQQNRIVIPQDCIDNTKKLCLSLYPDGPDTWDYERCLEKYGPYLTNIYQTNQSINTQECILNTMLGDPILNANHELGVLFALILDNRIVNCDSKDINNYNDIFSTDQKIKVINECLKTSIVNQKNFLSGCRLANKTQININNEVSKCLISTTQTTAPPKSSMPQQVPTTTQPTNTIQPTTMQQTTIKPIEIQPTTTKLLTKLTTTPAPTTTNNNLILIAIVVFSLFIISILIILKFKNII